MNAIKNLTEVIDELKSERNKEQKNINLTNLLNADKNTKILSRKIRKLEKVLICLKDIPHQAT
jgi:hypothetical protein